MAPPADAVAIIRRLEARVARLEAARQLPTLDLRDGNGRVRVRLGRQVDGEWGIRVWDVTGALVLDETAT